MDGRAQRREAPEELCYFSLAAQLGSSTGRPILHVAAVGEEDAPVLEGFRACPGTHVVLLHAPADAARARRLRDTLCEAGVPTRTRAHDEDAYHGLLRELASLLDEARVEYADVHLNVSSGSRAAGCALVTASYLHGVKAFSLENGLATLLPILPHDQLEAFGVAKVAILRALFKAPRREASPRALRASGLDPRELEHHVDGDPESTGLITMGLVERGRRFGLLPVLRLTARGSALVASGALAPRGERRFVRPPATV